MYSARELAFEAWESLLVKHCSCTGSRHPVMRLLSPRGLLAFSNVSSLASATINLTLPFSSVKPGETYELGWRQDKNHVSTSAVTSTKVHMSTLHADDITLQSLELLLVRQTDSGWNAIDKLWDKQSVCCARRRLQMDNQERV